MFFSRNWFFDLDKQLRAAGLDSDAQSFDEILENLRARKIYNPDEFASHCAYVILAGGFSQKTAKKIHEKIMDVLQNNPPRPLRVHPSPGAQNAPPSEGNWTSSPLGEEYPAGGRWVQKKSDINCALPQNKSLFDVLIKIFNNKNKINAICKIWENRHNFCRDYYALNALDDKLKYLQKLPHIGKITANHLARNLGEDVVKYDVWIQRLGCVFADKHMPIDNGNLSSEIKTACDEMFAHLKRETGLPRGYIDVVLWKSCQVKLISMDDCLHKPPVM